MSDRARLRARGPSVEGAPLHRRPRRRTSYPDLALDVNHIKSADVADSDAWSDDDIVELGPAPEAHEDDRWSLGPELPRIDRAGVDRG